MKLLIYLEIKLIRFYQIVLSPDKGIPHKLFHLQVCLFVPTCSDYAIESVRKYGIFKGNFLSLKRIIRCGPWSYGKNKYDPVP